MTTLDTLCVRLEAEAGSLFQDLDTLEHRLTALRGQSGQRVSLPAELEMRLSVTADEAIAGALRGAGDTLSAAVQGHDVQLGGALAEAQQAMAAALPDPSALSVELQDALLSARRTLSGAASVSRAAVKRRVRCFWAYMPAAQLAAMLSALAGSAVTTLSYPDPLTGQSRAMQAYCGERSVGLARQSGGETVWTGVEIIFMEA